MNTSTGTSVATREDATRAEASRADRGDAGRPARPIAQPEVPVSGPVTSWGLTNRIIVVAAVLLFAGEVATAAMIPADGSVVMGEGGRGFVPVMLGMLFALIGGALAGMFGSFVMNLLGGPGRSAVRYIVGGLVGGIIAVVALIFVFSNTVLASLPLLLVGLPLAGLIGGVWAGVSAARR